MVRERDLPAVGGVLLIASMEVVRLVPVAKHNAEVLAARKDKFVLPTEPAEIRAATLFAPTEEFVAMGHASTSGHANP